jgi:hypothetical protein
VAEVELARTNSRVEGAFGSVSDSRENEVQIRIRMRLNLKSTSELRARFVGEKKGKEKTMKSNGNCTLKWVAILNPTNLICRANATTRNGTNKGEVEQVKGIDMIERERRF